jgi:hypothetical protein
MSSNNDFPFWVEKLGSDNSPPKCVTGYDPEKNEYTLADGTVITGDDIDTKFERIPGFVDIDNGYTTRHRVISIDEEKECILVKIGEDNQEFSFSDEIWNWFYPSVVVVNSL